jgi:lipoprotein-releasing system permease protein
MPWYLYLAIKQLFPSGKGLSFFSVVSIVGVMLGVAVLIIVLSVMNGFGEEIRKNIVDTGGHVRIQSSQILENPGLILEQVRRMPEVAAAEPYAEGVVMLQHRNIPAFPFLRGVDIFNDAQVVPIGRHLLIGEMDDLDDGTALMGTQLAAAMGVGVGSVIEVYSPLMIEKLKRDEVLLPQELEVVGIFETGYNPVDSNVLVVSLRRMQELYGLGEGVHGIGVRLHSTDDTDRVAAQLREHYRPPLYVVTWFESNSQFLLALQMEKVFMFFIILFIILVASFSIASSLLTSVVRKTREIGLLGAMGGRPIHLAALFCLQGMIIGIVGTGLGVLLALVGLHYRNGIVHGMARIANADDLLRNIYNFADLPVHYNPQDFFIIITFSIIIATLAGLLPAWRAARLNPSEAMRHE